MALLTRRRVRVIVRALLVARLPGVGVVARSRHRAFARAPHALVQVVSACASPLLVLSAAFVHEDLVPQILIRCQDT